MNGPFFPEVSMPACATCGTLILFGGVRDGSYRFCNKKCHANGFVAATSNALPDELVDCETAKLHAGRCPKCGGPGPVDLYTSHTVMSFLIMTRWASKPEATCRSCARKRQLGALASSAALGWWGIPWGFIITPVQVVRNLAALASSPSPLAPSPALREFVRTVIAAQIVEQNLATMRPAGGQGFSVEPTRGTTPPLPPGPRQ